MKSFQEVLNLHSNRRQTRGSKMSEKKKTSKEPREGIIQESRQGRLCPKCKDYNMDEEGYCPYCREKTGTSET
jgi:hypothetical protein